MKVNFSRINNGLEINKKQIQASIAPKTRKEDKDYKYKLYSLVSVSIAQNLILQNNKLDKAIRILAQDVILNEFTYLNDEKETDENLISFWKNNINELYNQVQKFTDMALELPKLFLMKKQVVQKNCIKFKLKLLQ